MTVISWEAIASLSGTAVAIIIAVSGAVYNSRRAGSNRIKAVEDKCNKLDTQINDDGMGIISTLREIKNDIKSINANIAIRPFAESNSPRKLTESGETLVKESGVGELVDSHFDDIVEFVKSKNPKNTYEAEQFVIDSLDYLAVRYDDVGGALEVGAYNTGTDTITVSMVGAIYVRDRVLKKVGFSEEDIAGGKKPGVVKKK